MFAAVRYPKRCAVLMLLDIFCITTSTKKCATTRTYRCGLPYCDTSAANLSLCSLPYYDTSAAFVFYKTWLHTDILLRGVVRKGGGVVRSV